MFSSIARNGLRAVTTHHKLVRSGRLATASSNGAALRSFSAEATIDLSGAYEVCQSVNTYRT